MKKILTVAMALIIALGNLNAQPKDNERAWWKMAKQNAKENRKKGFQLDGTETLENAFYHHYQMKYQKDCEEITAIIEGDTKIRTVNQAQQWADATGMLNYAKKAGAFLKGKINGATSGNTEVTGIDMFLQEYEAEVKKEIQGELIKTFGMYQKTKDGEIKYTAYFLVPKEAAMQARQHAFEKAKKELDITLEMGETISKFVNKNPVE